MKKFLVASLLALSLTGCSTSYSDGYRVGTLQKFTKKGWVFRSYEGELALAGSGYNVWSFSVLDEKVVQKLSQYPADKPIKLQYKQWLIHNPLTMTNDYEITAVEEMQ
jgi:hypothetical protein